MNGLLVGCCEPPSRSTVTATTDPLRTGCSSFTATVPPPPNVPAGAGRAALDHPRLVGLPGRCVVEVRDDEHALVPGADDDRAVRAVDGHRRERAARVVQLVGEADVPDPEADHEARGDRDRRGDRRARSAASGATRTGRRCRAPQERRSGAVALARARCRAPRGRPRGCAPAAPAADRPAARRRRAAPSSRRARPGCPGRSRIPRGAPRRPSSRRRPARRARRPRSARCRRRAPCRPFLGGIE